jgi:hypothetical protein
MNFDAKSMARASFELIFEFEDVRMYPWLQKTNVKYLLEKDKTTI